MWLLSLLVAIALVASGQSRTLEVTQGSTVTLRCIVDGATVVMWKLPNGRYERRSSIKFEITDMSMYGTYECFYERDGKAPKKGKSFTFIPPRIVKPKIMKWSEKTRTMHSGSKVKISCKLSSAAGDPSMIKWEFRPIGREKDPRAIRMYEFGQHTNGVTIRIRRSRSILKIRRAKKRHAGRYDCVYKSVKDFTNLKIK